MKKRLKAYKVQYAKGELDSTEIRQRLVSWLGHVRHGHTYALQKKILSQAVFKKDWEYLKGEEKCEKENEFITGTNADHEFTTYAVASESRNNTKY